MEEMKLWPDGTWCLLDEEREYMSDDFMIVTTDTTIGQLINTMGYKAACTFFQEVFE